MVALHTGSQTGPVGAETTGRSRYPAAASGSGGTRAEAGSSRRHGGPLRGLASIVAGRRTKWLILAVWLIAVFAVFSAKLPSKLSDKTTDSTESFLPSSAESTRGRSRSRAPVPAGPDRHGIVVYKNAAGLTAANQARIAADARAIQAAGNDKIHLVQPPAVPFERGPHNSPGALVSKDGTVAVMVLTTPTNFDKEGDWGKAVRDITDKNTGDMQVYVTGNLGLQRGREGRLQQHRHQAPARHRCSGPRPARRDLSLGAWSRSPR